MGTNKFTDPRFHDENAARAWFEATRWPDGPVCPHCGSLKHYANKAKIGVYRCGEKECRKDFTVMTKSVMERSHAKLTQWAVAFHMGASSKKGFSAHQLHRELGCQYNTAWFLWHRVREAMRRGGLEPPLGSGSGIVEADETYFGQQENRRPSPQRKGRPFTKGGNVGPGGKRAVVALVERGGSVRSFHPAVADGLNIAAIVRENIAREARLMTDESRLYIKVGSGICVTRNSAALREGIRSRRRAHQHD
jgi:transposase-like protein